jgi:hypothetical protein
MMPAVASAESWHGGGLSDYIIRVISVSPYYGRDFTVFAGTTGNGVFKSTDGGRTWAAFSTGLTNLDIRATAVSPNFGSDQTVFAATAGGVFRTTNGGSTWIPINNGLTNLDVKSIATSPNYPSDKSVFAGTSGGVFRSSDGGASWTQLNSGLSNLDVRNVVLSPHFTSDQTVFAGTYGGGVFKSTDGGSTWSSTNIGITNLNVTDIAISPSYPTDGVLYVGTYGGGMFKSATSGNTWIPVNGGILEADKYILTIAISPDYPIDFTAYGGTNGGVYYTKNGGASWKSANDGLLNKFVMSLDPTPCYCLDKTVYAGSQGGGVYSCVFKAPPITTLATNPVTADGENGWFKTNPTISFGTDKPGTTYYQWDSTSTAGWTTYSSSFTAPEGHHTLYYFSQDTYNDKEPVKTQVFNVDKTKATNPTVTSPSHTVGGWSNDITVDVNFSGASDSGSGVAGYSIQWSQSPTTVPDAAVDLAAGVTSATSPALNPDGAWYFHISTKDAAGNWSLPAHVGPFNIDTSVSNVDISAVPASADGANGWYKTAPAITLTKSETGTAYYQWDSTSTGGWQTYSTSFTPAQGVHTVYYYMKDQANNSSLVRSRVFMLDSVMPTAFTLSAPANNASMSNVLPITFTWTASSDTNLAKYEFYLDGYKIQDNIATSTTAYTVDTPPSMGAHTWYVNAVDAAGNTRSSGTYTVNVIDGVAPTTALRSDPSVVDGINGWFKTKPVISFNILNDDPITSTTYYQWNSTSSGGWQVCANGASFPALEGQNTLYYYSQDATGNKETVKSQSFKVDTMGPADFTLISPVNNATVDNMTPPTFTWNQSIDSASGFAKYQLFLDGLLNRDSIFGTTYTLQKALTVGTHTWCITAVDECGNVTTSTTYSINVNDVIPPSTALSAIPANAPYSGWYNPSPSITLSSDEMGTTWYQWDSTSTAGWQSYSSSITAPEGQHTLYYYSQDAASNKETVRSQAYKVDTTAPTVPTLSSPANNGSTDNASLPTFTWAASTDAGSGVAKYQLYVDGSLKADSISASTTSYKVSAVLAAGSHTWYVKAVDTCGNAASATSFTLNVADVVPPSTTPSANRSPVNGWFNIAPSITLAASEPGSTKYQWDSTSTVGWQTYSSAITASEGQHTLYYYSTDASSNAETVKSQVYKVDTTGPAAFAIGSPTNGSSTDNASLPTFTWAASTDAGSGVAKYQLYVDGSLKADSISAAATSYRVATPLAAGTRTWYVKAVDLAGNSTQSTTTSTLNVNDVVPPVTALSSNPYNNGTSWINAVPSITLNRDEQGTTYYQWDTTATAWTTYSAPFTAQEGIRTLYYFSEDKGGNREAVKSTTFKVDATAPTAFSVTAPANGSSTDNTSLPTFTWTASSDAGSGLTKYQLYLDGSLYRDGLPIASTSFTVATPLAAGTHTWYVKAVDIAGNAAQSSTFTLIVADIVPPVTALSTNPSYANGYNSWFTTVPSVTLTRNEPGTTYVQWDSTSAGGWQTYTSAMTAPQGIHTLYYYSVDTATNNETLKSKQFKVDSNPSEPTAFNATSPINGQTVNNDTPQTFTWGASSDSGSGNVTYTLYVDGTLNRSSITGTTITLYQSLSPGNHTWYVKAIDEAGNAAQTQTLSLTVKDVVPPSTTMITNPSYADGSNGWFAHMPSITFTANELATTYYQWDGMTGAWTTYAGAITGLEGQHTLYYYSKDTAGNNETVKNKPFNVDVTVPTAFDISTPSNNTTETNAAPQTFTWTPSSDAQLAKYQLYVDNVLNRDGISASSTSVTLYQSLTPGTHTWYMKALDVAGNTIQSSSIFTVNIKDVVPPTTSFTTNPSYANGSSGWYKSIPSVTFTANEQAATYYQWDVATGAWTAYTGAITAPSGNHTLYYYSVDTAGNKETNKTTIFRTDTDAPAAFDITSPANNATANNDKAQTFKWAASLDTNSGIARYRLYIDGAIAQDYISASSTSYTQASALSPGTHTWYVVAVDNAGNTRNSTSTNTITINDVMPPTTAVSMNPAAPDGNAGWYKYREPSILLTRSEPGTTYYQWDGTTGAWTTYSTSLTGAVIPQDGQHTLYYYSVDANTNTEAVKSITVKVDTTVPTSAITTPTDQTRINTSSCTITGTANDNASGSGLARVEVAINNGAWRVATGITSWSYPWSIPQDGTYTIKSRAFDIAGNESAATPAISVTVDTAPPSVSSVAPAENATGIDPTTVITAMFSESVDPATIDNTSFTLQDGSNAPIAGAVTYDAVSRTATFRPMNKLDYSMAYTATVTTAVKDMTGTNMVASKTWSFTVKPQPAITAPVTTLNCNPAVPDGSDGWFKTSPSVTFTADKLNTTTYYQWGSTSGIWNVYDSGSPLTVPDGTYTLYYYSVDAQSNTETARNRTFKVDAHAPDAPGNVTVIPLSYNSIQVSWNAANDAVGVTKYEVYNATTGATYYTSDTNFTINSLTQDTTYTCSVAAYDAAGNKSARSVQVSAKTYIDTSGFNTITDGEIISLGNGITVKFTHITKPGKTFASVITPTLWERWRAGPLSNFSVLGYAIDIHTTASYTGDIYVTYTYNPKRLKGPEKNLRLKHWDGTQWVDITAPGGLDMVNHKITGITQSLSPTDMELAPMGVGGLGIGTIAYGANTNILLGFSLTLMLMGGWLALRRRSCSTI